MGETDMGTVMHMIGRLEGKLDSFLQVQTDHGADHIHLETRVRAAETAIAMGAARQAGFVAGGKLFWALVTGIPALAAGVGVAAVLIVPR